MDENTSRQIEGLQREVDELRFRAELAESHAANALGGSGTAGWTLFLLLSSVRWKLAPRGTRRDGFLRRLLHPLARWILSRYGGAADDAAATDAADALPEIPARKAVLFISQAPEVSRRYRCDFQAEQLEALGAACDVMLDDEVDLDDVLHRYGCFVLHRVPFRPEVATFIAAARSLGKPVLFDTDDLVFDPDAARHVAAYARMEPAEQALFVDGMRRYRETLRLCDAVIVSTEPLREQAQGIHHRVVVAPNVLGGPRHDAPARARGEAGGEIVLGYLSGTATHDRDFEQAAGAVCDVLDRHPLASLEIVGPLATDARLERFGDRVRRRPFVPWEELPSIISRLDVNLAPLEPANPFTDCKSSIKYIEAGAFGVPTVASPTPDFARSVVDGTTGILARDEAAWSDALLELAGDPDLRVRLGATARADVLERHTTRARAAELYETVRSLTDRPEPFEPLTINFVMLAPIARNSGGYRNIFRIAQHLVSRGHVVRACIEPVAHLEGMAAAEIEAFVEQSFGPLGLEIVVGHENLPPADVSIATFWRTAAVVARHRESLFKAYYIQDFEPEFYAQSEPEYRQAAATYHLPLRHVCLGRHLAERVAGYAGVPSESIDFAIDAEFQVRRDPAARGERIRVLYFARPSLRRRGYELGLEALRLLKERHPDCEIAFFGSADEDLGRVPFAFTNLGVLTAGEVAAAMNDAHILLTFSLTNISNVPYEGMACGCAVVDVDLPNVSTMVANGSNCLLSALDSGAIAQTLAQLVTDDELRVRLGRRGADDMQARTWERTAAQFEESLTRLCFTRMESAAPAAEVTRRASGPRAAALEATELDRIRAAYRADDFYLGFVSAEARAVLEEIIDHPGFAGVTDPPALMQLAVLVRTAKPLRVLQLGTLLGFSAIYLADILRGNGVGGLTTVDPDAEGTAHARNWAGRAGLDDRIWFVEGFSTDPEVGRALSDEGPYDLVYLDSSHLYETTLRELDLIFGDWLAPDGIAVIHDAAGVLVQDAGVRRAVDVWHARNLGEVELFILEPPFWPVPTGLAIVRRAAPAGSEQAGLTSSLDSLER